MPHRCGILSQLRVKVDPRLVLCFIANIGSSLATPPMFETIAFPNGTALRNAATPEKHQIETMAGGVAVFDFDNDGRLDLFFVNGAPQPSLRKSDPAWWNRLYRNLGGWKFEDVTEKSGLAGHGYGFGVAAGDYDNDGFTDLFVTGVKQHSLYRNRGDGTFEDVTAKAGIAQPEWSIGAGWFDFDKDGDLDLFIVNYVVWEPEKEIFCGDQKAGYRAYCHPKYYVSLPNTLYRNNGDGTFTDVSKNSGVGALPGKGMAVLFADLDGDSWPDAFVTNDTTPNFLFRNRGDGTFEEIGVAAGVGMNEDGLALSSMGADFRDVDNDGRPDIFVTALANETFPLYFNLGKRLFRDVTYPTRIGSQTLAFSGWSGGVFDFDNDGWKDLFAACGDVNDNTEVFSSRKSKQRNLLMWSQQAKSYQAVEIGAPAQHRGAAFGDLDNDGRVDAVLTRLNEPPLLLRNVSKNENQWLTLRLRGRKSNRQGLGASIQVTAGGLRQWNHATTATGYASASDAAVHFGLGAATKAEEVRIHWPSGQVQILQDVAAGQILTVDEP